MIASLRGQVIEIEQGSVVLDVGGVGYEVFVTDATARALPEEQVTLHIRLINREGEWSLYGFQDRFDRRLFDLLVGVNGVGPRHAMSLLGDLGPSVLAVKIAAKEAGALTVVSGIGPKLAQRIVLEISERVAELAIGHKAVVQMETQGRPSDVESALVALGYTKSEARRAAGQAQGDEPEASPEQLVRKALAIIADGN
jgi:Holliday junction DNA helicase RuvA